MAEAQRLSSRLVSDPHLAHRSPFAGYLVATRAFLAGFPGQVENIRRVGTPQYHPEIRR